MDTGTTDHARRSFGNADEDPLLTIRRIGRAFADIGRVRILAALGEDELCTCHLATLLGLDPATVLRHVKLLVEAGLVTARREGKWTHCRRANPGALLWRAMDELGQEASVLHDDAQFLAQVGPESC